MMFVWRHGKWQPFFFLPKMPNKHHRMRNELVLSAKSAEHSAFTLWLNSEKKSSKVCGLKNNPHLCSALHLRKARRLANNFAAGIFCVHGLSYSSVPCGALMRPLPFSRCSATGSGTFSFPYINILFHFKALQK
jgi:hypothetical protein